MLRERERRTEKRHTCQHVMYKYGVMSAIFNLSPCYVVVDREGAEGKTKRCVCGRACDSFLLGKCLLPTRLNPFVVATESSDTHSCPGKGREETPNFTGTAVPRTKIGLTGKHHILETISGGQPHMFSIDAFAGSQTLFIESNKRS